MRKAYYIDTFSTGHLHEMFNASSLLMFAQMYEHIEYRTSYSSYISVLNLLGSIPSNVSFQSFFTIDESRGWKKARRLIKQMQAILKNVYYILSAPKDVDVIINYNTLAALPMVNWAAKRVDNRVLQICHGELKELAAPFSKNILLRNGVSLLQKSDRKIADNLKFAVLGKSIYKNVYPLVNRNVQSRLLCFEHTAVFPRCIKKRKQESDKLVLGTIGTMRDSKGKGALLKLAQMLNENDNVEIRCIGNIDLSPLELSKAGIVIPVNIQGRFITRAELYEQVRQLDYALFLFPPEIYKFTASGSLFDAIGCEVPIIALRNDYFENIFREYGECGYLEDSINHVCDRIIKVCGNHNSKTNWNFEEIKDRISPISIAKQFCEQWMA